MLVQIAARALLSGMLLKSAQNMTSDILGDKSITALARSAHSADYFNKV